MSTSFSSLIRNFDNFGHQIKLNINKQDRSHKTVLSGIVSIITNCLILSMVITKTQSMLNHDN